VSKAKSQSPKNIRVMPARFAQHVEERPRALRKAGVLMLMVSGLRRRRRFIRGGRLPVVDDSSFEATDCFWQIVVRNDALIVEPLADQPQQILREVAKHDDVRRGR